MTPLTYVGIEEVSVYDHALGIGARLVVASPDMVLVKEDYPEAWMAHEARRIILYALNARGTFSGSEVMRGEILEANRRWS